MLSSRRTVLFVIMSHKALHDSEYEYMLAVLQSNLHNDVFLCTAWKKADQLLVEKICRKCSSLSEEV